MNTLGAHEVLELHEVLNETIQGLNTLQLYRPFAREGQLQTMINNHFNACTMEYNNMVQLAHSLGASQAMPQRMQKNMVNVRPFATNSFQPMYGLHQPQTQAPVQNTDQIDDADVALCLVGCHKQSANMKMKATLEMAHPVLRQTMQAAANKAADMAYEAFQYANQKGYYQVPTLKDTTMNTYIHAYGTTPAGTPVRSDNYYM
ncbi:spore coat protein [Paenibacillus sp. CAA11]|uniref:spore coat protein n=1 Tax=Paenibacillus sp. CAA11 TaxID=1532905 RepID=UPI000D35DD2E|nr:spore coat protein [Paenibacillus sp. CAA11]AWB43000.1 spore coat protein [Paenibacillus sp. CAA11]